MRFAGSRGELVRTATLVATLVSSHPGHAQSYEVLARYLFDSADEIELWELQGLAEGAAYWDSSIGEPDPGSARFEVVEPRLGQFTDTLVSLGPCLPPLPSGAVLEIVGQRRTLPEDGGYASTTCEMGFAAYDRGTACEGLPDAWTSFPPPWANPWYPGPFLPYELRLNPLPAEFEAVRPRLVTRGGRDESCWFDSIEVRLISSPAEIPTVSWWALLAFACALLGAAWSVMWR